MIEIRDKLFHLSTENTSYIFRILDTGQLENLHYGPRLIEEDYSALETKTTAGHGSTIAYTQENPLFSLDTVPLEYSGIGKGDFRHSPMEIKMPDGTFVTDFIYVSHSVTEGCRQDSELPGAYGGDGDCDTLTVILKDRVLDVELCLFYTVFSKTNVIVRRTVLTNREEKPLFIRKLMSMMLDLPSSDYNLITFDGGWIKETHKHIRPLSYGIYVNDSTTGASSNRHNPGIILCKKDTNEDYGECLGINLIYSGNHYEAIEISNHDLLRVMSGINPHCFEWELGQDQSFSTPEAILTYSSSGLNSLSHNFHGFIRSHIVRGEHKEADRPVLLNNWEAHFFKFNRRKLLRLARGAAKLGVELFVLDDGWFGDRNSDTAGLGDYNVNRKKLPGGLSSLAKKINGYGMKFGLWFEPEMVNEDSNLFREHPEYAIRAPGREPSRGRNQLVLDLCNPEVRDYIVENVNQVLDSANIAYVKWDMNRHITDMYSSHIHCQGEFFHRYILGLYDILKRITGAHPSILFESCSSGGNRFDLGMLCYMPQVWSSDNTDPIERLNIQEGLSYLYPPSTMGAHVSASPHQQTLRTTPLPTRFNVAAFGLLGYELDLSELSYTEKKEIKAQIAYYKGRRRVFQYGRFYRFDPVRFNRKNWQVVSPDKSVGVLGNFQTVAQASPASDILSFKGLDREKTYKVKTVPQTLQIKTFGGLLKHVFPISLKPGGFVLRTAGKYYSLPNGVEEYTGSGNLLHNGIKVTQQFMGTGYSPKIRILSDFGSQLMDIEETEDRRVRNEQHGA